MYLPLFKPIIGHKMKLANKLLCLGTALLATLSASAQILPGEQAPPANPGQRNFGGFQTQNRNRNRDTTGMAAMMRARMAEMNRVRTLTFDELSMSDPFIYPDPETHTYYLTSSGGRMYKSKDLKTWEGPYNIIDIKGLWLEKAGFAAAAEIHKIGDYYYYAGTWSDHSDLIQQDQPRDWDCIDGTLYEENGKIYMIFVHEWTQIIDGTMDYIELAPDLSYTVSEHPVTMFRASELPCCGEMNGLGEATFGLKMPGWVTDGPQMFRTQTGKLGMLWSTWGKERYLQAVCYSESGTIAGPWVQEPEPFLANNSGHGMLFRTFEGKLVYIVHHVEGNGPRKPQMWSVDDSGDKLVLLDRWFPE